MVMVCRSGWPEPLLTSRLAVVVVPPPDTNRALTIQAPSIQLRELQIRAGSCQEAILEVLSTDPNLIGNAVSADQVDQVFAARGARHARGTVYKTLRRMARRGLLQWSRGTFRLTEAGLIAAQSRGHGR